MNNDLISRQAAKNKKVYSEERHEYVVPVAELDWLPPAQPEQSSEIQDILEYLDTVLHPIISPDHWNVYSELHDMISMLPSVQPQRWIPVTERLPEYDFTDVLICLHDVRHGCEDDYYIIQAYTVRGHWKPTLDINMDDLNVVAWMPLPEPYKGEQNEGDRR